MTNAQFTPGPWELSYDKGSTRDVIASSDSSPICVVRQSWVSREAYHANARLIHAAPDLFQLAARMLDFARSGKAFVYPPGSLQELEQTIAKATGAQP